MRRRTLIRTVIGWISLIRPRLQAQPAVFPGKHEAALRELAATLLPESLGRARTDAVAQEFIRWVREYRPGAEMQTGYGTTRVRYKGASPAPRYMEQLDGLAASPLVSNDLADRRRAIAQILQSAKINDLPFAPDGNHIAPDLMTFYFQSTEANDLAYEAKIGKDLCRALKDSGVEPASMKKGPSHADY